MPYDVIKWEVTLKDLQSTVKDGLVTVYVDSRTKFEIQSQKLREIANEAKVDKRYLIESEGKRILIIILPSVPVILPCPFCGSKKIDCKNIIELWHRHAVREHPATDGIRDLGYKEICKDCGGSGPLKQKIEDALDGWNKRTT